MAITTTALVGLDETKRFLQLGNTNEYDKFLIDLIDIATSKIEHYCQRTFVSTAHRVWIDGSGTSVLMLPDTPVTSLTRVAWNKQSAITVDASTASDIRATVEVQDDGIVLKRWDSAGDSATSTVAFSDQKTCALMATAITALTGWTATSSVTALSEDLIRQGGQDAKSGSANL